MENFSRFATFNTRDIFVYRPFAIFNTRDIFVYRPFATFNTRDIFQFSLFFAGVRSPNYADFAGVKWLAKGRRIKDEQGLSLVSIVPFEKLIC